MNDYQYKLNCGQYVLHSGDHPIAAVMDELAGQMARDLTIISGKFPVEELNRCLSTSGYVLRMVDKLQRGLIGQEPQTMPAPLRSTN